MGLTWGEDQAIAKDKTWWRGGILGSLRNHDSNAEDNDAVP